MNDKLTKVLHGAGVATFCAFLGCWAVFAHQANSSNASSKSKSSAMSDAEFAKKAAQGNMAEVKLGELAQEKGSSDAVKNFGKRMVNDHSKANEELKTTAAKDNIQLPSDLDTKDQAAYDRLSKLSGPAFDKAYSRDMVRDHEKDVAEFHKEANAGKNEDIKNYAAQTAPILEDHLKEARKLMQSVSAEGVNKSSSSY
jgi:putative membrane protein